MLYIVDVTFNEGLRATSSTTNWWRAEQCLIKNL